MSFDLIDGRRRRHYSEVGWLFESTTCTTKPTATNRRTDRVQLINQDHIWKIFVMHKFSRYEAWNDSVHKRGKVLKVLSASIRLIYNQENAMTTE
ncbi:hypothetical protein RUM43_008372 [Polyplax serrata]|uniref:Uncharacterized protein n=1 Tax=Polyplax serrata TaxID=468196 RepID=A0AAN8S630_POLSC